MDAPDQFRAQCAMHRAMAGKTVFPLKFNASQHDIKVAFTGSRRARMTRMTCTIVHNHYLSHVERRAQLVFDFLPDGLLCI